MFFLEKEKERERERERERAEKEGEKSISLSKREKNPRARCASKEKQATRTLLTVAGAVDLELAGDLVERVRQARHQPRLDELGLAALEGRLLLDGERRRLHAELLDLVVSCLDGLEVRGALLDDGAGVGDAGALDLEVGQALELVEGDGVDGGGLCEVEREKNYFLFLKSKR